MLRALVLLGIVLALGIFLFAFVDVYFTEKSQTQAYVTASQTESSFFVPVCKIAGIYHVAGKTYKFEQNRLMFSNYTCPVKGEKTLLYYNPAKPTHVSSFTIKKIWLIPLALLLMVFFTILEYLLKHSRK